MSSNTFIIDLSSLKKTGVFILQNFGVEPCRLDVTSYGKDRPIVEGTNEKAKAANRAAITTLRCK